MHQDSLETMLARLATGDDSAATEAFLTYEPYLRMVVRRRLTGPLRSKFDSVDIVQSVWAKFLGGYKAGRWQFANANGLRAFLVQMARNHFLNHLRHHRRAIEHEETFNEGSCDEIPSPRFERPSAVAQANDVWEQIQSLCDPAHRELLQLRRQGLPLAELAARSGLHESSVRRIFYDLARRFGQRQKPEEAPVTVSKD